MINQPESTIIPEFRMTADFERNERWICAIRAALSDMLFSQTVEDCQDITDKEARQIADTVAVAFAESVREGWE